MKTIVRKYHILVEICMVCAVLEGKQSLRWLLLFVLGFLLFLSGTQFKHHLGFFVGCLFACLFVFWVKVMHQDVLHIIAYGKG